MTATPIKRSKLWFAISDSLIMIRRSATHIIRNTDQLLGTFFQPIMFLVLFTAVFGGAIKTEGGSYINFLMAGIIVQTLAFGSTTTAIAVATDLKKGIVDRFRSLPMSNLALLTGHVISDIFRNFISVIVMIVAGLIIGFRPNASLTDWLAFIGLVTLFTLALSWLMAIIGVVAKSVEGVQWLTFIIIFPLTFASSAFVDTSTMTSWLKIFAENQPVTHMVNAVRSLLIGTPMGSAGLWSLIWSISILIIAMPLAAYVFKRKTSN
ncbi:MAG: transporter permease [Candidatus Saccharibacteria bacterium]|nr:transporter permease [Candidatus Saccharibacteria bacterium]